jgi:hypothetical protein
VHSTPDSLLVHLDGAPVQTPFDIVGVNGLNRYLTPPYKQVKGDSIYFFRGWEDGSLERNREIKSTETTQSLKGYFDGIRNGKGYGLTAYYYDNSQFAGTPVAVAIDPVIDHQYLLQSPYPGVPADNFGIAWKGYIQPLRSGIYQFTAFADDGVFVDIDGQVIIQNWEPGTHHESGSLFLEGGRLYPVHIRMYEYLFGAQLRLRWSSDDFPEEVIPSSQLYPADYLPAKDISSIELSETVAGNELILTTASFRDMLVDFSITGINGITYQFPGIMVGLGTNTIPLDISRLAPGVYYLKGIENGGDEMLTGTFVKVR